MFGNDEEYTFLEIVRYE